jgi:exonuclease I
MDSGFVFFVVSIIFFIVNVHWNNKLYAKKVELEDKERKLNLLLVDINTTDRLDSILENINEGLDEWQGVEEVHCPEELQSFKKAQEEIEELMHDLEVVNG